MDLKQLFESNLLNEETKQVIQEHFEAAVEARRVELEETYTTKLKEAKSEMAQESMGLIEEALKDEIDALAEEVAEARTLEVRYAHKLETFKEDYDKKMQEQLETMVSEQVSAEMDELKEDVEAARQNQFAQSLFESFRDAFEANFGASEGEADVRKQLAEAQEELGAMKRAQKLDEILEGVTGTKRQVAETLLEGVPTERLEARFESLKGVLLAESKEEKEEPLTEDEETGKAGEAGEPKGEVVLEQEELNEEEQDTKPRMSAAMQRALRNAGLGR